MREITFTGNAPMYSNIHMSWSLTSYKEKDYEESLWILVSSFILRISWREKLVLHRIHLAKAMLCLIDILFVPKSLHLSSSRSAGNDQTA